MIAVDTNVVVRLLTQDDEQQYNNSLKLFPEQDEEINLRPMFLTSLDSGHDC